MLGRLVLLFLLTPAVELALLIQVDRFIGFWPTVGLIIATGIAGSYLARREGLSTWRRLNERLRAGDLPGTELVDGVIILVAGALLITPGVLTDGLGFIGLLPPTRALIRRVLIRRLQKKVEQGSMQVHFGAFGGARPGADAPNWPPSGPDGGSPNPDPDGPWEGDSRRIPRHADEPHEGSSSTDAPSSS